MFSDMADSISLAGACLTCTWPTVPSLRTRKSTSTTDWIPGTCIARAWLPGFTVTVTSPGRFLGSRKRSKAQIKHPEGGFHPLMPGPKPIGRFISGLGGGASEGLALAHLSAGPTLQTLPWAVAHTRVSEPSGGSAENLGFSSYSCTMAPSQRMQPCALQSENSFGARAP